MKHVSSSASSWPFHPDRDDELRAKSPQLARLDKLKSSDRRLSAPGIEELRCPMPASLKIAANVEMNFLHTCIADGGVALATSGVSACVVLCARGIDPEGRTVLSMAHVADEDDVVQNVFGALRSSLAEYGVQRPALFLVGGLVTMGNSCSDTMDLAYALLDAGGEQVESARLGVSGDPGWYRSPGARDEALASGMPSSVSVVLTADGVFYRSDDDGDLFDGRAVSAIGTLVPGCTDLNEAGREPPGLRV